MVVRLNTILFLSILIFPSLQTILFKEEFNPGWETRWKSSKWKEKQQGLFISTKGKWYGDIELASAIQTSENMKFYELSTKLDPPINTKDKTLVLQYSVKFEQVIDCGGGYIKLINGSYDSDTFGGESPVVIMFGPDICGTDNKVHLILDHKGKGYLWKKRPYAPNDKLTHIYTFALYPNGSYAVYLDAQSIENGTISDDWQFTVPKEIPDPDERKPAVNFANN